MSKPVAAALAWVAGALWCVLAVVWLHGWAR